MRSRLLLLLAGSMLVGCGVDFWAFESVQNSANPHSTLVLVWLADSPVDDADMLEVTVDRVELIASNGAELLSGETQTFDLLRLRNGNRMKLAEGSAPSGTYQGVRLTLRDSGPLAPRIHRGGAWEPLAFAGPGAHVIDVPYFLVAPDDGRAEVQIDFNARLSVVEAPGGLDLDPHLDAVDPTTAGEIEGRVRDAVGLPQESAAVIARHMGLEVRATQSELDGTFRLTPLAPGLYDVELWSPAGPLMEVPGVLVTAGAAANVVLTLP